MQWTTPLIPAIWSSSKHAWDREIRHLHTGCKGTGAKRGAAWCRPPLRVAFLLINFPHDRLWSQINKTWAGELMQISPRMLKGNVNCFSNLFISPLVAVLSPLCFWWRPAEIYSFSSSGVSHGVGAHFYIINCLLLLNAFWWRFTATRNASQVVINRCSCVAYLSRFAKWVTQSFRTLNFKNKKVLPGKINR